MRKNTLCKNMQAQAFLVFSCVIVLVSSLTSLRAQDLQRRASDAPPFEKVKAHQAIEELAKQLQENFIYPKIGKAYADMLRTKVEKGAYSRFKSSEEFARVVTADLQAVHPEGHLKLQAPVKKVSGNSNA